MTPRATSGPAAASSPAGAVPTAHGQVVSTLYTVGAGGLEHRGSTRIPLTAQGSDPPRPGVPEVLQVPPGQGRQAATALVARSPLLRNLVLSGRNGSASGGALERVRLGGQTLRGFAGGRAVEIQFAGSDGLTGATSALSTYVDGRFSSVVEVRREQRGDRWILAEVLEVSVDSRGKPVSVLHLDYRAAPLATALAAEVGADCLAPGAPRTGDTKRPFSAGALAADEGPCSWWNAARTAAWIVVAGASAALSTALAACPTPLAPYACPAVISAAAAYAVAWEAALSAEASYQECMTQQRTRWDPGSPSGPGGPGGGEEGCGYIVVEISYDGGITWYHLTSYPAC